MPLTLSDETRRLLELITQQQPTGSYGYIEGNRIIDATPVDTSNYRPATAEDYARVEMSPTLDDMREHLSNQRNSQPQTTTVAGATQELPDAKQRIDDAILSATMPQAPNQHQQGFEQGLLLMKSLYDAAKDDEQRQAIHKQAENLRNVGNAAGYDLSGYGSGVTFADATQNLATQQARDIAAVLSGQGAYSKTSEQYYTDTYYNLLQAGYSPRQARKFAGNRAREYQANRVAYLDGVYNSYGRDGLVTNSLGNQMLAQLGMENPSLANFYANSYPGAKDAYQQENQLAQLALTNENAMARAIQQTQLQDWLQNNNALRDRETHVFNAEIDDQFAQRKENRTEAANDRAYQKNLERIENLADRFGFTGENKKIFVAAGMGIKLPNTKNGKLDNKSIENAKKVHDMLDASEKNLLNQLKTESGELDNSNPALLAQLEQIRAAKQQIENLVGGELGSKPQQNGVQEFSDDDAANNESLTYLWNLAKGNMETYRQYVSNWLDASGVTPHFKEQYLKNLQAYQ